MEEVKMVTKQEEPAIKLGLGSDAFCVTYAMIKAAEIGTRWTRERTSGMGFSTPLYEAKVIDKENDEAFVKVTTESDGKTTTELFLIRFL